MDGADVAIIAPPCDRDVTVGGNAIVCGVEIDPSGSRTPRRAPCMRGIGAYQTRLACRRQGPQITADIAGGESQGSQASNLQMSEVLTNASALFKKRLDRRCNFGRLFIELKIAMDHSHQFACTLKQRPSRRKRLARVAGKFVTCCNALRSETELESIQALVAIVVD